MPAASVWPSSAGTLRALHDWSGETTENRLRAANNLGDEAVYIDKQQKKQFTAVVNQVGKKGIIAFYQQ